MLQNDIRFSQEDQMNWVLVWKLILLSVSIKILEALHIRNMQQTLKRINFQTSTNELKCL